MIWSHCGPRDYQESSPAPQFKSINSSELSLHSPTRTSIHDYWKNHQFSSAESFSHVWLLATLWTAAHQAPLSITSPGVYLNSCPLSQQCHPSICCPLLSPSIFPSIKILSNESVLHIKWPKCWSFSISPSNECSGLISFRIDWFDLLAVQGTLKSLL